MGARYAGKSERGVLEQLVTYGSEAIEHGTSSKNTARTGRLMEAQTFEVTIRDTDDNPGHIVVNVVE